MKPILLKITAALFLIAGYSRIIAQDCTPYYPVEKGAVREMASYDKKDKLTGTTIQIVKDITTAGDKTEWLIGVVSKDEKGKEISAGDLRMSCEAGIFKMDMKNFVNEEQMKGFEGMDVTMDATDLDFPASLTTGQSLKDGSLTIKVNSPGMSMMNMVVRIYDRKVEGQEEITTPAGTFQCYKLTSTIETKTMFSVVAKSTEWIAKDVGTVRSETYDKNGKLMGYTVLTAMKM
jgi:hypothetical protein